MSRKRGCSDLRIAQQTLYRILLLNRQIYCDICYDIYYDISSFYTVIYTATYSIIYPLIHRFIFSDTTCWPCIINGVFTIFVTFDFLHDHL